jgi:hypothetical protein
MTVLALELLPWRVGRRVGRTIYAVTGTGDDVLIGVMDTRELAAAAVAAHNRGRADLMTRDDQLAWLQLQAGCGCETEPCEHTDAPPPDAVTAAAMRIIAVHGWFYDPPLSPETVLQLVELAADPEPWLTVDDDGRAVRMVPAWWAAAAPNLYRAVPVDDVEG